MLKLFFTGLWVCLVTLGAVYFSVRMSAPPPPVDEEAARKEALQLVRGEAITIPVITDGMITGYFLGRFSFMMDRQQIGSAQLPVTELATDELFTVLVGEKMVDLGKPGTFDLEALKTRIRDDMNTRLGEGAVAEVLVEQLDFVSKEDIRTNNARDGRRPVEPVKLVEGETIDEAAAAGH